MNFIFSDLASSLDVLAALLTVAYIGHLLVAGRAIQIDVFQKRSLLNQQIALR